MLMFQELKKLISNRSFLLYVLLLMALNLFLLWFFTRPNQFNPPQSAYSEIMYDMRQMNMEQKEEFLLEKLEYSEAMYMLENLYLQEMNTLPEYYEDEKADNAELIDEYGSEYTNGAVVEYTDSIRSEFAFVNEIYKEFRQVAQYEQFLNDIDDAGNTLAAISIFADEDSYDHKNIVTTQQAYQDMRGVEIDYQPQKGVVTATTFIATDVLLFFAMILISFTLIQQEKQSGVFRLIRSTPNGRGATALAKFGALAVSLLGVVALLYGTNLLFCEIVFGLGDLSRSVQSVPELMRSTLRLDVGQYLAAFTAAKWVAALVCGLGILLSMLVAKDMSGSIALSFVIPLIFLALWVVILPTSTLNFFRYANVIGYLQTSEILGSYRNLHWFGGVIDMVTAQIGSAIIYTATLFAAYMLLFMRGQFIDSPSDSHHVPRFRQFRLTTVFKTEWRKVLLLGGGLFVLLAAIGYYAYDTVTHSEYISSEETIYRDYMTTLSGTYTEEKHEFLLVETERFSEIIELEKQLMYGHINQQQYDFALSKDYLLAQEYNVFKTVLPKVDYIQSNPGAQFLYDTGYRELFLLTSDNEFDDSFSSAVISVVMCVVILGGYFSIERVSGVRRILYSTPLGREKTVVTKLINSAVICFLITVINTLPFIITTIEVYGMSGLLVNAKSLSEYSYMPIFVTILSIIILQFVVRLIAILFVGAVTLAISQLYDSYITVVMISLTAFLLPLILCYIGFDFLSWLTVYPMFDVAAILSLGSTSVILPLFYGLVMGFATYLLCCRMIDKYCWNFTDL